MSADSTPGGQVPSGADEMFQLVDRSGRPVGQASRRECHGSPRLIHLVVHLHVFDADGRLYLQKRSMSKDTNPGLWDTSVGGHVAAGESVRDALIREAREELDIDAAGAFFLYSWLSEGGFESEFAECFAHTWSGTIHPDPVEIDKGRFFRTDEVREMMGTGVLTPMFEREWPMLREALRRG
jgi:isopentenyldiphosphate isomerase